MANKNHALSIAHRTPPPPPAAAVVPPCDQLRFVCSPFAIHPRSACDADATRCDPRDLPGTLLPGTDLRVRSTILGTVRGGDGRDGGSGRTGIAVAAAAAATICAKKRVDARQNVSKQGAGKGKAGVVRVLAARTFVERVERPRPGPPACGGDRHERSRPHAGGWADLLAYCSSGSHPLDRQSRQRSGAGGRAGQHGHGRGLAGRVGKARDC